jgi:hypothetical protein
VDLSNPDAARFAVVPYTDLEFAAGYAAGGSKTDSLWLGGGGAIETIRTPLYRNGKEPHGDVPCAACHGGAHAVWPNRDPKANDNVTALELQGHAGNIDDCTVCHGADAFKNLADLDGGRFRTDLPTDSGVLGGPHNLHPVCDENWWKSAEGDTPNSDGSSAGGNQCVKYLIN